MKLELLVGRRQGVDRLRESGVAAVARFPLRRDLSMPFQPVNRPSPSSANVPPLPVYPRNSSTPLPKSCKISIRSCHVENVSRTKTTPSSVCQVSRALILLFYIVCIFGKGMYIFIYVYVYRMRVVLRVATCGEPTSVLRISLPRHIHRGLVGSSIVWYGVEQRRLS